MKKVILLIVISVSILACQKKAKPVQTIENEVIIQLDEKTDISNLEEQLADYGIQSKKQLSKSANIWLVRLKKEQDVNKELLQKIKQNKGVKEVNFNRKTTLK